MLHIYITPKSIICTDSAKVYNTVSRSTTWALEYLYFCSNLHYIDKLRKQDNLQNDAIFIEKDDDDSVSISQIPPVPVCLY